mmetsp:Transcript_28502/g.29661  ORF Transcript_28502/g.29661 Transcript_28502/m.29661 type:complete len:131 (-) Transcript_28502:30-422(-)
MGAALANCCVPKEGRDDQNNSNDSLDSIEDSTRESNNKEDKGKDSSKVKQRKNMKAIDKAKIGKDSPQPNDKSKANKNEFYSLNRELSIINDVSNDISDIIDKEESVKEKRQELYNNFAIDTDTSHITKD